MDDNKFILIGGENDGKVAPIKHATATIQMLVDSGGVADMEIYERVELVGENSPGETEFFTVYKHEDIDRIEMMQKLIDNYNPKQETDG